MTKRIISLILSIVMVLSMMPVHLAASAEEYGTESPAVEATSEGEKSLFARWAYDSGYTESSTIPLRTGYPLVFCFGTYEDHIYVTDLETTGVAMFYSQYTADDGAPAYDLGVSGIGTGAVKYTHTDGTEYTYSVEGILGDPGDLIAVYTDPSQGFNGLDVSPSIFVGQTIEVKFAVLDSATTYQMLPENVTFTTEGVATLEHVEGTVYKIGVSEEGFGQIHYTWGNQSGTLWTWGIDFGGGDVDDSVVRLFARWEDGSGFIESSDIYMGTTSPLVFCFGTYEDHIYVTDLETEGIATLSLPQTAYDGAPYFNVGVSDLSTGTVKYTHTDGTEYTYSVQGMLGYPGDMIAVCQDSTQGWNGLEFCPNLAVGETLDVQFAVLDSQTTYQMLPEDVTFTAEGVATLELVEGTVYRIGVSGEGPGEIHYTWGNQTGTMWMYGYESGMGPAVDDTVVRLFGRWADSEDFVENPKLQVNSAYPIVLCFGTYADHIQVTDLETEGVAVLEGPYTSAQGETCFYLRVSGLGQGAVTYTHTDGTEYTFNLEGILGHPGEMIAVHTDPSLGYNGVELTPSIPVGEFLEVEFAALDSFTTYQKLPEDAVITADGVATVEHVEGTVYRIGVSGEGFGDIYYTWGNQSGSMWVYGYAPEEEPDDISSLDALKAAIDAGEMNILVSGNIICGPEDTLTIPENVIVEIPDGAALTLNGTVNIAGTVVNHGSLWVNMNSITTVASTGNIINYGNIHVGFGDGEYSSTLNIAGEVVSYGYFNITDHGEVNVTGTVSNQMAGPDAGFIDLKGKLTVTGTLQNQSGPSITVEGGTLDVSNGTYGGMFPVTVFLSSASTSISGIGSNMLNYCYRVTDQDSLMAAIEAAKTYGHINAEMNTGFTLTENVTLSNVMLTIYSMDGNSVELTVADGVTLTNNAEIRIGVDATLTVAEGGTLHNNSGVTVASGTANIVGNYTSDSEDVVIFVDANVGGTVSGAPYRASIAAYDYKGLLDALELCEPYAETGVDITVQSSLTIAEDLEIPAYVNVFVAGNPYSDAALVVPYGVTLINNGNLEINCAELSVHSGGKLINNGDLAFNAMPHGIGGGSLGGEFVNNGILWVNTGSTVDMGGSTTNYGNIHVGFGEGQTCTLNIDGDLTTYGYLNLTEYGYIKLSGTMNVAKEGDYCGFLQDGGTVDVIGTLNVFGLCVVGNDNGQAKLYVAENGIMNVTNTEIEISGGEMGVDGQLNTVNGGILNNGLLAINRSGEANFDENSGIVNNNTLHVGMGPEEEAFKSILNVDGILENYGYFCIHDKGAVSVAGELQIIVNENYWGFMELHGEMEVSGALHSNNQINVYGSLNIPGNLHNDGTLEVDGGSLDVTGTYEGDGVVHMYCEYGQINVSGVPNGSIEANFTNVTAVGTLVDAMTSGYKAANVSITGNIVLTDSLVIPAGSSLHVADFRTDAAVYARNIETRSTCASLTVPEGKKLTIEGSLDNEGNVIVSENAELCNKEEGIIENTGSLMVEESASVVNEGSMANEGLVTISSNAALTNSGVIKVKESGEVVIQDQGAIVNNGTMTVKDGEITVEEGGTLEGNQPFVPVASIGDTDYSTLTEALADGETGDTVILLSDTSERDVIVKGGITLDLNGHALTAEYVFAVKGSHIVDSSTDNTGILLVDPDLMMMSSTNSDLPVWTGEGFIFIDILSFQEMYSENAAGQTQYIFSPTFEPIAHQYLTQGMANSRVKIAIRMSWEIETGSAFQNFVFNDETVKAIIDSFNGSWYGRAFSATITSSKLSDFDMQVVLISDTGVELICN